MGHKKDIAQKRNDIIMLLIDGDTILEMGEKKS